MIWDIVEYHDGIDIKNIISNVWYLPSGKRLQFAIENGPVEIVDLPINSMLIFHSFLYVYPRVDACEYRYPSSWWCMIDALDIYFFPQQVGCNRIFSYFLCLHVLSRVSSRRAPYPKEFERTFHLDEILCNAAISACAKGNQWQWLDTYPQEISKQ